jgi:sister-chromatid-cohesion protein PDS5
MRLVAAQMMLKLCSEKHLSPRLSANAFNQLALVTMDSRPQVRRGFVEKIMKYMGQNKLSPKFFTPLFLLGHEPDAKIKNSVITWLKSRAAAMGSSEKSGNAMDATFARLLSCLAWHPDWPAADASAEDIDQTLQEMLIFILFYLQTVGTKDNLGLVYHVAQRVKGHQDGIVPGTQTDSLNTINERLYVLSDLAQKTIRHYADNMGWMVQVYAGKVRLPAGIFRSISDVDKAREVAMKNFLPKDFEEGLEDEVRALLKSKKVCSRTVSLW